MAFSNPTHNSPNKEQEILFETKVRLANPEREDLLSLNAVHSGLLLRTLSGALVSEINFSDLIGLKCVKICDTKENLNLEFLAVNIISYPIITGFFRGKYRSRTETILKPELLNEVSNGSDETETIFSWKNRIHELYYAYMLSTYQYYDVDGNVEVMDPFRDRKLLVLLNPVSGRGCCHKVYKEQVSQVFEDAGIEQDVVVTTHKGHAQELVSAYDLTSIQGIACLGGDGTVHEVVNGLMRRPDWRSAIKLPISPIPCGSGNGLAKTVLEESGEEYNALNAAFLAVFGGYVPFDIAIGQTETEKLYFFLGFSWGMIADSDIESEKLRFIGESRFTLAGLKCIFLNKVYSGTLHYLPFKEYQLQVMEEPIGLENLSDLIPDEIRMKPMMGAIYPQQQLPQPNTACNGGDNIAVLPDDPPQSPLLLPLDQELPDDWVSQTSQFVIFNPTLIPYLTRSIIVAPYHDIGCGYFTIVMGHGGKSRLQLLQTIRCWESGIQSPECESFKVEAFRICPETNDGVFTVDGEEYPVQKFQAQVIRKLGRIVCRKLKEKNPLSLLS